MSVLGLSAFRVVPLAVTWMRASVGRLAGGVTHDSLSGGNKVPRTLCASESSYAAPENMHVTVKLPRTTLVDQASLKASLRTAETPKKMSVLPPSTGLNMPLSLCSTAAARMHADPSSASRATNHI